MVSVKNGIQLVSPAKGPRGNRATTGASRCRKKFLRFFPRGFRDDKYYAWERGYKEMAHRQWGEVLGRKMFSELLSRGKYVEIAAAAVRIESRTNLLFSFEKMALRDALKSRAGARTFAQGLFQFLHGPGTPKRKFAEWCDTVRKLPRRKTRVLTWPLVTVFGFIAQPERHIFLKPNVTREAARNYEYDFVYQSQPSWEVYDNLLGFAEKIREDLKDLDPADMIDLQSFIWVQGSDEYAC